jgi:hypothetical protein
MPHFKTGIIIVLFALISLSLKQPVHAGNNDKSLPENGLSDQPKKEAGNLDYLKKYAGKFPHDVKLLDNPALAKRLKKLLGPRFAFVKKTWAVETPMQMKDNVFSASGCQTHNCGDTNFIIAVDFSKNVLYAGIRQETKVKLYAEDGSTNKEITDWANSWDNRR